MPTEKTILAHNIRFLRKKNRYSQEQLSDLLKIKRSNIAAYESKSVEPRLRIIMEIARIFNVDVGTMIETRLEHGVDFKSFSNVANLEPPPLDINLEDNEELKNFVDKSVKMRKVLEGFKAFYTFRKKGLTVDSPEKEKIIFDIDNFIQLMDHLLNYNENVINAIGNAKAAE